MPYEPKPEIDKRVAAITPQDVSKTHTIVDRAVLPPGWTFRVATVWGIEDILSPESVFTLKLPIWIGYDYEPGPGGVHQSMLDGFRAYVTRHGRTNTLFVGNVLAFQYPPQTTSAPPTTVRITWPPPGPARIYSGFIPFPDQMTFRTNAPGTNLIVTKRDHEYFFSPDKRLTIR